MSWNLRARVARRVHARDYIFKFCSKISSVARGGIVLTCFGGLKFVPPGERKAADLGEKSVTRLHHGRTSDMTICPLFE